MPAEYSIPDQFIPRGEARARLNPPTKADPGIDTSLHPDFRIWRNTDANLESGPLTEGCSALVREQGFKPSVDAEGKTIWIQAATGRVTYRLSEAMHGE